MAIIITIILYFSVLLLISRRMGKGSNDAFFRAGRKSAWQLVAFGMIGASISGVTFVSVPGMVLNSDMTYLQMCMGFWVGYLVVAFVLLPIYYRYNLTSIYSYLDRRLGRTSRKTGSWFFIASKLTGSAAKLYLVCLILEHALGVDFTLIVVVTLILIWLYTHRSGTLTLVWTDALQTLCMLVALVLILIQVASLLKLNVSEAFSAVWNDPHSRIFEFDDWSSRQHFLKQFLSGVFVVIVMTGLDQDMMQKNLTCRTLRDGQKDLCSYGILFLPVNFLFMALGVLLAQYYNSQGMALPENGDALLPKLVTDGVLGQAALIFFTLGIIAAAFSSADSALTALTTSFCVDILEDSSNEHKRKGVHICMTAVFLFIVLAFRWIGSQSVIDLIYTLVGYTYGPLLGLFAFALFTRRMPRQRLVPYVAIASPLLCYAIDQLSQHLWNYHFGYELLMFNGLITFLGLWSLSSEKGGMLLLQKCKRDVRRRKKAGKNRLAIEKKTQRMCFFTFSE